MCQIQSIWADITYFENNNRKFGAKQIWAVSKIWMKYHLVSLVFGTIKFHINRTTNASHGDYQTK